MNDKQIQEAFIQFLAQKSGAKNQQELEKYVQSLGEDGLKQAYQEFTQVMQKQAQKAAHGTKLQYLRNLKHQCAEDEELVYYKKGGSLDCGCVKKKEDGGEVTKAEEGWKSKFKNRQKEKVEQTYDEKTGKMRPATPKEIEQRKKNRQDAAKGKGEGTPQRKKGGELKKNCGGSTLKLKKKGGEVCPKCGKVHAAGMGCAVAKFKAKCGAKMKKHQQGDILNGVPFMQQGKNLPTAPKAEDRYRGGQRVSVETRGGRYGGNDRMEIKEVQGKKPGMFGSVPFIRQTVLHSTVSPDYNDTTYIEVPERKNFLVERKLRGVEKHPSVFKTYYSNVHPFFGSILPDLGSGTKEEYETLKRRFNTAWNLAK